jgi:putative transferase (TIGR04331 family)
VVSRLLVTTPLELTWSTREPILFLGEWCRLFERRALWSTLDSEVLAYHWNDRNKLESDFHYLSDLHERLLVDLAAKLNEIHGVTHSVRYWRVLVGPWLGYFVQMFFDRWESIQHAVAQYELSATVVLTGAEKDLVPQNMADFNRLFVSDEWNHHIYAFILRRYTTVRCVEESRQERIAAIPRGPISTISLRRVKRVAAQWLSRAVSRLTHDNAAFLIKTYLPFWLEFALHRRLGQTPQYWLTPEPEHVSVDWRARAWTVGRPTEVHFESAVRELIPKQLPTTYLEGYARLVAQASKLRWPQRPRLIWTSNAHHGDDVFKAWAAAKVESGTPLVLGQHGGHFGVGRWNFIEDHEIAIADRYLSWGWSKPQAKHVIPIGQLKAKRPLGVDHGSQPDALLVTFGIPRYSYWMYSIAVSGQYLNYLDDQYAFIEALPTEIRRRVVVRLYSSQSTESSWNQKARMEARLPDGRFDGGRLEIKKLISRSRLFIATYNATTYLESFTMNVPTVIFWNPAHWELRDSAKSYFEDLKRVGIFHETPESAARHVAAIWNDVNGWWRSAEVREVVQRFIARYSQLTDNLLDRLETALREVDQRQERQTPD